MSGWWGLVAAAVGAPVSSSSSGGLSCRGEVRKTGRQLANRPTAALLRLTRALHAAVSAPSTKLWCVSALVETLLSEAHSWG